MRPDGVNGSIDERIQGQKPRLRMYEGIHFPAQTTLRSPISSPKNTKDGIDKSVGNRWMGASLNVENERKNEISTHGQRNMKITTSFVESVRTRLMGGLTDKFFYRHAKRRHKNRALLDDWMADRTNFQLSQKRCMVSGSLCPASTVRIEYNVKLVVIGERERLCRG